MSDRRLCVHLLGSALVVHALALMAPWVREWTSATQIETRTGLDVLSASFDGAAWGVLALTQLLSVLTLAAAWWGPRTRWGRGAAIALLVGPTVALAVPLAAAGLWNGADAWPEGPAQWVIRTLAPGGWWVESGLLVWGVAQALYVGVLMLRLRGAARQELQRRWAGRSSRPAEVAPSFEQLGATHPALRPLVLDARRLRVDLDAPVRPLDTDCRDRLMDLAIRLVHLGPTEHDSLRRAGVDPLRLGTELGAARPRLGWWAELHVVDGALHRLIDAATRPGLTAYR